MVARRIMYLCNIILSNPRSISERLFLPFFGSYMFSYDDFSSKTSQNMRYFKNFFGDSTLF